MGPENNESFFQAEVHFVDGHPVVAKMVLRTCQCTRKSWEPFSEEGEPPIRRIVVMFEGQHTHPALPPHKLTIATKDAIYAAFVEGYPGGTSASKLIKGM